MGVNPIIQEVIRKEVIRFLYAGMIYPISDSPWVSPLHVVSKKEGLPVMKTNNDEVIATKVAKDGVCV